LSNYFRIIRQQGAEQINYSKFRTLINLTMHVELNRLNSTSPHASSDQCARLDSNAGLKKTITSQFAGNVFNFSKTDHLKHDLP